MKLEEIGFYTLSDKRAENVSIISDLQRCELILTDVCNFKCPYCRGVKNDFKKTLTLKEAENIVDLWASNGLKNIRFSGGEPTLWPELVKLIEYTKNKKSIKHIAISTNGSSDIKLYRRLVKFGVNDFSISLDACCSSMAKTMSGKNIDFNIITNNIKELSNFVYVTVGVVLTDKNISQINDIIKFSESLGVSDIRIIPSAQYDKRLSVNITDDILQKYPILNYRINNIKNNRHVRGMQYSDSRFCHLVLDDMAVIGDYHFPCIIYLREQGEPIGSIIGKTIKEIRKERYDWMVSHDCYKDNICFKNCLDVCVDYNNRVSELRIKKVSLPKIDEQLFTKYTWEGAHISSIFGIPMRTDSLIKNKDKISPFVVGWCRSDNLTVKPKDGQIAVMFEKEGTVWWNHLTRTEFLAISGIGV